MSLPNITKHIIATGASVQLKVSKTSDTPSTTLTCIKCIVPGEFFSGAGQCNRRFWSCVY
jgi:hypothetical protein